MTQFSVTPSDLRKARAALDRLGKLNVDVSSATLGMHAVVLPEAAGMLESVAEKASTYQSEIGKLMAALSTGLAAAAVAYEGTDKNVAGSFAGPR